MIPVTCSHCGAKFQVKDEFAGRTGPCPTCKQPLSVPLDKVAGTLRVPSPAQQLADSAADRRQQVAGTLRVPSPAPPTNPTADPPNGLPRPELEGNLTLDSPGDSRSQPTSVADLFARHARRDSRYTIAGEIARGGMGAVVRAVDCDIRREVAIKYMLDESNDGMKARFVEEAQITGQLEHPNIVPIHELGLDAERRLFFAMKMVRGRSLGQILHELRDQPGTAEKTWSLGRLLNVFVNVCHALAYAHSRGVIHRDLKPANIMVGDFGEVYVMDWGLAKVLGARESQEPRAAESPAPPVSAPAHLPAAPATTDAAAGPTPAGSTRVVTSRDGDGELTQQGAIMGTPAYMSPEQAHGKSHTLDGRSDIYSLGAILYELLTLESPIVKDGGHLAVLLRVATGEIQPPEQRAPQRARQGKIPKELAAVAMKALALKPENRYAIVENLRRDIERFQEGRSVSAKNDSTWESAVKFVKRNKAFSAATATASVVLAVVVAVSLVVNYRARLRAEDAQGLAEASQSRAEASQHKAEENYAQYVHEQQVRRDQAKTSVPAFVAAARLSVDRKDFDAARAQVDVALDFDPDYAPGRLLKAQLLLGRGEFSAAREELAKYVRHEPADSDAARLIELCTGEQIDDPLRLGEIADVLFRQGVSPLAEGLVRNRRQLAKLYQKRIEAAWPGAGAKFVVAVDGALSLDLSTRKDVTDLGPLRGIPLNSLMLSHTLIQDLSPLQGMPLALLHLKQCIQVKDLSPLRGMKLKVLILENCSQVKDCTPLVGMPLTELGLAVTQVADLAPLAGMPLQTLSLFACAQVNDLTVLHGMPLTNLILNRCDKVRDFTPLQGLPLTELDLGNCKFNDLALLQGMPLKSLALGACPIPDLTLLRGMKLSHLSLVGTRQIRDLSPLAGMPLVDLDLRGTLVEDLTLLAGLPLERLAFHDCQLVEDLTPLVELPLVNLGFMNCNRVKNLAPLRGLRLATLEFSPKTASEGIDAIREMKTLKFVSPAGGITLPTAEFWRRYDAGEFRK